MTVCGYNSVVILRRNKPALIKAEHSAAVLKGLGSVKNFRLVNAVGKFAPDNILHFNANAYINIIRAHFNAERAAEIRNEVRAAAACGYNYFFGFYFFAVGVVKRVAAVVLFNPFAIVESEHFNPVIRQRVNEVLHCEVVFIRSEMLYIHIQEAKIILQTLKLQAFV